MKVAPFAGAWIEILVIVPVVDCSTVAPFAGAWIEIVRWATICLKSSCRSLRGSVD